jgi:hypothetical protein
MKMMGSDSFWVHDDDVYDGVQKGYYGPYAGGIGKKEGERGKVTLKAHRFPSPNFWAIALVIETGKDEVENLHEFRL